jgi:uncharacterized protein YjbJ (UPF0337 family)
MPHGRVAFFNTAKHRTPFAGRFDVAPSDMRAFADAACRDYNAVRRPHAPPSARAGSSVRYSIVVAGGALLAKVSSKARSPRAEKGGSTMASGKMDQAKGRVKEAAGALTDDKRLKREGKADQAAGKIKQKVEETVDKVKNAFDRDR